MRVKIEGHKGIQDMFLEVKLAGLPDESHVEREESRWFLGVSFTHLGS